MLTKINVFGDDGALYTVETDLDTYKDQTLSEVANRAVMIHNGGKMVVTPQTPVRDYQVFYGGENDNSTPHRRAWNLDYGWAQGRVERATNHRDALIARARTSQHSSGTRYGVAGPERGNWGGESLVLRFYRLDIVESPDEADFTCKMGAMGTTHYKVTEITR